MKIYLNGQDMMVGPGFRIVIEFDEEQRLSLWRREKSGRLVLESALFLAIYPRSGNMIEVEPQE